MNRNASSGILTKRQATLYIINRILCGAVTSPLTMTSIAIHMLQNRAEFFKHACCLPMTQFEDSNHVGADATDETKIVTTKFVLGFCHGQL